MRTLVKRKKVKKFLIFSKIFCKVASITKENNRKHMFVRFGSPRLQDKQQPLNVYKDDDIKRGTILQSLNGERYAISSKLG